MGRSLKEILNDTDILHELINNPGGFTFKEAPSLLITMVSWPRHTRLRPEDMNSPTVKAGIPTNFPIFGPMSYVLATLAEDLNFTYKQVIPPDVSFGVRSPNGSWSGMMRQVYGKQVDIGLGLFQVIQSRAQDVDYTVPFSFDTLSLMVARGSTKINPWGFLNPFLVEVWMAFFLSLIIVSFAHLVFDSKDPSDSNVISRLAYILFEYIQPPMGHALHRKTHKSWQRPVLGSWVILSLIFNVSYDSNLRSLMALRYIPQPIQTLRDAIEASSRKLILEHRTSFTDIMGRVPSGDIRELDDAGKAGRYVDLKMKDFMNYYHLVKDEGHIQIFDIATNLLYFDEYFSKTGRCDFYIGKEKFIPAMYAMTLQKHSPLTAAFNARISRLFEAGMYDYWTYMDSANITACANPPVKIVFQDPIGLESIWGLFVIWATGLAFATVILISEILIAWISTMEK